MKKAIILLSGSLDSTTVLAIAQNHGFKCYVLSFDYGQRHKIELEVAKKIAAQFGVVEHKIAKIDLRIFGGSSLTADIAVPKLDLEAVHELPAQKIPTTYVPARNTIFLSYALAYGETVGAFDIFIGANSVDYSNYPDCREEYLQAYEAMANLATAAGANGSPCFKIHAPLLKMTKAEIIKTGVALGVDYAKTHSCYDPKIDALGNIISCGKCDSCQFRLRGFRQAGLSDEILYQ